MPWGAARARKGDRTWISSSRNRELWPIHERIRHLMTQFDKVSFSHVRREFNQLADGMVNRTLDAHANE
ncbi:MAG: reverse transcriptase-like protein [Chloroflexi bacterium]|nr:MAG: reverse transcriptase-like protein [Chloroflexota bacterium]